MYTSQLIKNSDGNMFNSEGGCDITEAKDVGVPNVTDAKCGQCLPNQ